METQVAQKYIENSRLSGFSDAAIRQELQKAGWEAPQIEDAFRALSQPVKVSQMPEPTSREERVVPAKSAPTSFVPASVPMAPMGNTSSGARKVVTMGILLFLVASGAGAGWWYYDAKIFPKTLLRDALSSFAESKSYRYDAEFQVKIKESPSKITNTVETFVPQMAALALEAFSPVITTESSPEEYSFRILAKGAVDVHDEANPSQEMKLTFETKDFFDRNISLESRLLDGTYYAQFTELPRVPTELAGEGFPPIDTASFEQKWVRFDPSSIESSYQEYLKKLTESDPTFAAYLDYEDARVPKEIEEDDINRLRDLYENSRFIVWEENAYEENNGGRESYRFKGKLDKAALSIFVSQFAKITGEEFSPEEKEEIERALSTLGDAEFNVWVSRETREIQKMSLVAALSDADVHPTGILELSFTVSLSDIGTRVTLSAPENAIDFTTVLDGAFSYVLSSLDDARKGARDALRIANLMQIRIALEFYYEQHDKYPQTLDPLVPEFLAVLPKDPTTGKRYGYKYIGSDSYVLSAQLEDKDHPRLKDDLNPKNTLYELAP